MPELPEVETTRRGIEPHILGKTIQRLEIRQPRLRWPIPRQLNTCLTGKRIQDISRRGKYLLITVKGGTLIIHLGMSGSLRILKHHQAAGPHDHVDLWLSGGTLLRFTDPRRFGAWLWTSGPVDDHPLLSSLGPEPLSDDFNTEYLHLSAQKRKVAVKPFIMNSHIVVGVGNIYANEALFRAGIHPARSAGRISRQRYGVIVTSIKSVLLVAIDHGGTTLRDFVSGEGSPGYFKQNLLTYGRTDAPCKNCGAPIREIRLGQRSTFYCGRCQH